MDKQLGFLMDLYRCIGCHSCATACRNEHRLGNFRHRRVLTLANEKENVFTFLSMSCNHCQNPACLAVCPQKCFKKRRDGVVIHAPLKCNGCGSCVGACPFGAPRINPQTGKVSKCNLCPQRLTQGLKPACVSACPTEALQVINLKEPPADRYVQAVPGLDLARITKPSVRFNLPQAPINFWRRASEEDSSEE